MTITVGNKVENPYDHIVTYPKEIDIFYEQDDQIFAVVITDKKREKTVIYFEENAVVIHGRALQMRALLSRKKGEVLSLA